MSRKNISDRSMASGLSQQKIVLVGRAGNGKSATGNSLLRREIFTSGSQATGVTMTCQTFRAVTPGGLIINVIDTPCLFDLITRPDVISNEIVNCVALAEEVLHAVVLVLSVRTRITKEEEDSLCTLQILFGGRILDYLIVLFTGGDELAKDNQTLETYFSECPEFVRNSFSLCGDRKVLFDNRTKKEDQKNRQIQQLLDHVAAIGRRNDGRPFTEEMHRLIKEETDRQRQEERNAEARYLATEIENEMRRLKEEHERNMTDIKNMVGDIIRDDVWEGQQRMLENMGQRRDQITRTCNIM